MSATRFNDGILALIAAYDAAAGLSGIPVYDGPQAMTGSDAAYIVVGHDGTLTADGSLSPNTSAGTFTQSDYAMGPLRQEAGYVNCVLVCQSGDSPDVPGQRAAASALLQAAEDAVAANGGYPAAAPGLLFTGTSDGRWATRQAASGVAVVLAYRVAYTTGWD
jgi:hypothetical protein